MAFNGAGVFSRIYSWVADKTNGINITASRMDTDSNDIAAAFNNCVTRDNQGKPSANFLASADASFDIGSSGVHWRDGWFSRNLSVGGTLSVTGSTTFSASISGTTASFSGVATAAGVALGANDSTGRGMPVCRYKAAVTNRSNNTQANDPDLTYAIPAAGQYAIRMFLPISGGAGGIKVGTAFSGTGSGTLAGYGIFNNVAYTSQSAAISGPLNAITTCSLADWLVVEAALNVTVPGTFALFWAQNTTNGTATGVLAGSYMTVTQVS